MKYKLVFQSLTWRFKCQGHHSPAAWFLSLTISRDLSVLSAKWVQWTSIVLRCFASLLNMGLTFSYQKEGLVTLDVVSRCPTPPNSSTEQIQVSAWYNHLLAMTSYESAGYNLPDSSRQPTPPTWTEQTQCSDHLSITARLPACSKPAS